MEFPELLRKNKVSFMLNKDLNYLFQNSTLKEVIQSMYEKDNSYCVILDETNLPIALINEYDILSLAGKGLYNNSTKVSDIIDEFKNNFRTVSTSHSIASVVKLMYRSGFSHLIVIDEKDETKTEGVISIRDFVAHLIEFFPDAVYNVNLSPTTENREGA